ncbi:ankyrin repeat-containing domain protein [Xylariales sp. PMI_506]|nr:ankyrin repeat-containing domain protein [Xylariales sp. PMI_506]
MADKRRKGLSVKAARALYPIRVPPNPAGTTALPRVLLQNYVTRTESVMHLLLDRGAHASDTCTYSSCDGGNETQVRHSVLSVAIPRASARLVSRLLAAGVADVPNTIHLFNNAGSEELSRNVTPLHIGALYSNFEGVEVLLEHNKSLAKTTDSYGRLPLHWVTAGPRYQDYMLSKDDIVPHVVQTTTLLLTHDPNTINTPDSQGRTALHYACVTTNKNSHQVVQNSILLLEKGADARYRDADGKTPMHFLLLRPSKTISELEVLELLATLLRHGADVAAADSQRDTPLHLAARNLGNVQIVKFLLQNGADASAINTAGRTPLHEAAHGYFISVNARPSPNNLHKEQQQQQQQHQNIESRADKRIRKQDEMMGVLLEAVADEEDLMNRPDAAGDTPRLIRDATRSRWRAADEEGIARRSGLGLGRGRGRGRGR